MNNNLNKIFLKEALSKLITSDYILLDLPYFGNVGDVLIWQSAIDLLNSSKYKCLYSASSATYKKPKIGNQVQILFMGGGNFGDLWKHHQEFRHHVMLDFPENPIIQLPQSICFQSEKYMEIDIQYFANHKGSVTICLRDRNSFNIISNRYKNVKAMLLPDLALAFDVEKYIQCYGIKNSGDKGVLYVRRDDSEAHNQRNADEIVPKDAVVSDWPTMQKNNLILNLYNKLIVAEKLFGFIDFRKLNDYFFQTIVKDAILKSGMNFIGKYSEVYTTRLHCGILAFLMGKNTVMFDNSYGKISGVYNLWLKDLSKITMI